MSSGNLPLPAGGGQRRNLVRVIIVGSVMFTFISYWRTAAVVLCDLASTAYYIGAIVEQSIGPAAPWFILGVMIFSGVVSLVYMESCALFVRGGVYRVVREAAGSLLGKVAVSALMFDFILTGPISAVTAGSYIVGLILEAISYYAGVDIPKDRADWITQRGSVAIAIGITLYFFWQNIKGIHESSDKALKIMVATTIMAVIMLSWCFLTLGVQGVAKSANGVPNTVPWEPHLVPRPDPTTGEETDPLGWLGSTGAGHQLRGMGPHNPGSWLSLVGVIGILIAFSHSILAMSGEETLAQVYREVESPKLPNLKKAVLIIFFYSLILTASISFLAVLLIPDDVRMSKYSANLIGGLAMSVMGPISLRFALNCFVVVVGFLILAGAVNTAIIGSNGVLNRVAEDGVMPDWFLKPHPRYGTTYRVLYLIVGLQLLTILATQGNTILLGEAYAFGVIWSFVFMALAMVILRFKQPVGREFKVPLNIRVKNVEVPIGLGLIFVVLLTVALLNLVTKEVATIGGVTFTFAFFVVFSVTEYLHERKLRGMRYEHLEQFTEQTAEEITPGSLGLTKHYRKLVAIRSPQNLFMLEKALDETDPDTTGVVVMTAKVIPQGDTVATPGELDTYDQQLMTAVLQRAEKAGKEVKPLIIPTNNPLFAVIRTAKDLQVQELVMGASNKYTADEQLEQIAFYWISMFHGEPAPLTVRILGRDRDVYLDLGGGNRIPKISERRARTVEELRAAGVGVDRVLLLHDGTTASSDLFQAVLTALDPKVGLSLVSLVPPGNEPLNGHAVVQQDQLRARQLGRELQVVELDGIAGPEIVRVAKEGRFDLIILPLPPDLPHTDAVPVHEPIRHVLHHAPCRVFLAAPATIPKEPEA
ncbi:MAG TPA: amino acid permease [Gemmataceae bacterium]|nr:amino acid permease [Gemmataceae bacterium]